MQSEPQACPLQFGHLVLIHMYGSVSFVACQTPHIFVRFTSISHTMQDLLPPALTITLVTLTHHNVLHQAVQAFGSTAYSASDGARPSLALGV